MNKSNLEYREEQKILTELHKVDNAYENYRISVIANKFAIEFFIICFLAIIISCTFELLAVTTNTEIVVFFIAIFSCLAFISICISNSYKTKTLNLLEEYYNKKAE